MRRHIITGATGFLGRYLVERLLQNEENEVVLIVRQTSFTLVKQATYFSDPKNHSRIRLLCGDVKQTYLGIDADDWRSIVKDSAVFWHLAANLSFDSSQAEEIYEDNVTGTENVIALVNTIFPRGSRLMYVSTAYVCGSSRVANEGDFSKQEPLLRNSYEKTKYLAEQTLRRDCLLPFVIFRPSIIIGDAYQGKAVGCTFGYYRFAYAIFLFKCWVRKQTINPTFFGKIFLRVSGARYENETDTVRFSHFVLPFPNGSEVNLVPVDYVIDSMIRLEEQASDNAVIHLTNPHPPKFVFLFETLLTDLRLEGIRLRPVSPWLFRLIIRLAYFIIVPWRKYLDSAKKYLPYMTINYKFETKASRVYGLIVPVLSRQYLKRVHTYALEHIFDKSSLCKK